MQPRLFLQKSRKEMTARLSEVEKNTTTAVQQYGQSIERCLGFLGSSILSKLDFVSRLGIDLKNSASQIITMMFAVSGDLSFIRAVVMRLDRGVDNGEHFVLEDATGRSFPIHMKTIISWEAFDVILNDRFKGKKGERRTRRKLYSLHESASHQQIDRSVNFTDAFVPYQKVDMSLMCKAPEAPTASNGDSGMSSCPWCKTVSPGTLGTRVQCVQCKKDFVRVVIEADAVDDALFAPSTLTPQGTRFGQFSARWSLGDENGSDDDDDPCVECQQPKRSERGKRKRAQEYNPDSESDEENLSGLAHITLRTKRIRLPEVDSSRLPAIDAASESEKQDKQDSNRDAISSKMAALPSDEESDEYESLDESDKRDWNREGDEDKTSDNEEDRQPSQTQDKPVDTTQASGSQPHLTPAKQQTPFQAAWDRKLASPYSPYSAYDDSVGNDPFYRDEAWPLRTSHGAYATRSLPKGPATRAHFRSYYDFNTPDLDRIDGISTEKPVSLSYEYGGGEYYFTAKKEPSTPATPSSSVSPRPSTPKEDPPKRLATKPVQVTRQATEEDAKKHRIPNGYSLKNWDPIEEPIMLLGSVFDAYSLGKWIYDWTIYHHGPATPVTDTAGELWLLLIKLAGKIKRGEETLPKIRSAANMEIVEEFIEAGERMVDKLRKLLKVCEAPMLASAKKGKSALGKNAGIEFVETMFGKDRELEKTERFMAGVRLWDLRFDTNCEEILRKPLM